MSIDKNDKNRVLGLDIVRSIAILLVVYTHGMYFFPKGIMRFSYLLPRPNIDGVSIFFVLSGFLIGTILLKIFERTDFTLKEMLRFWIRRWFRTLPNYFLILLILVLYQIFILGNLGGFTFKYLFFAQNLTGPHPWLFPEAWSLSVEEWFYFSFPIVCWIILKILKNKKKTIILAATIFIIVPFLLRIISVSLGYGLTAWDENYRKVVIYRLDSVMYGIIGAYVAFYHKSLWESFSKLGLTLSIILVLFLTLTMRLGYKNIWLMTTYGFNIESLATLFMLPYFSLLKTMRYKFLVKFFTFISIISYSMYLLNYTIVLFILLPLTMSFLGISEGSKLLLVIVQYILYWTYIIGLSFLLYKYFEKPMMGLRDKFRF
jgi:peptidoglycan/LPS O-acetylase OafA/YrhL